MLILLNILLIVFFVLMNAFFVVAEFAMVKVRKSRIEVLASTGSTSAKQAYKVVNDLNTYLSACQLGITLASLALGWIGEPTVSELISPLLLGLGFSESAIYSISVFMGFFLITALHIIFGELVPKSLAIINAEKFATGTAMPLMFFFKATYPIMWLFNHATGGVLKLMGYSMVSEHEAAHTDQEIKLLVEESYQHGLIDKAEYTYVDNIFEFTDKNVRDVMVPRTEMICIFKDSSFEEILETAIREKYTRYPVCDGSKDHVVGFIHVRDLYEQQINHRQSDFDTIVRTILSVPDSMPIHAMLKKFQKEQKNIAVVIDEYGGTAGMVTVEDILEEIVGDLNDEYDDEEKEIEPIDSNTFLVKGNIHLEKVSDLTQVSFPQEEYDTLNGFLIGQLGRIPSAAETPIIEYEGILFQIEAVADKRIQMVKLCKTEVTDSANGAPAS